MLYTKICTANFDCFQGEMTAATRLEGDTSRIEIVNNHDYIYTLVSLCRVISYIYIPCPLLCLIRLGPQPEASFRVSCKLAGSILCISASLLSISKGRLPLSPITADIYNSCHRVYSLSYTYYSPIYTHAV